MNIKEYNCLLVNHECAYTLWQYLIIILPKYFSEYNPKILLKFITLNFKEYQTILDTDFLKEYNLNETPKKYIKKYQFTNNIHYIITKDNKYKFTPEAFKQLILTEKNNIYKEYYLIIEKCMFYYMDYQYKSQKKIEIMIKKL